MQSELTKVARIMSQKYDVQVACKGAQAYTNGNLVVIPALPEKMTDEAKAIVRGYLDHEKGHVTRTDFEAMKAARLDPTLHKVWNYIEDLWTEAADAREYPGTKTNLNALAESVIKGEPQEHPMMQLFVEGRRQIGGYALSGPSYDREIKHHFGADVLERIAAITSTSEAIELARKLVENYDNSMPDPQDGPTGESEESAPSKGQSNDKGKDQGDGEQAESDEQGEGEGSEGAGKSDEQGEGEGSEGDGEGEDGEDQEGQDGEGKGKGQDEGDAEESEGGEGDGSEGDAGDDSDQDGEGDGGEGQGSQDGGDGEADGDGKGGKGEGIAEQGDEPEDGDHHKVEEGQAAIAVAPDLKDAPEDPITLVKEYLSKLNAEALDSGEYMIWDTSMDIVRPAKEGDDTFEYERMKRELGSLNVMRGRVAQLFNARTASRWTGDRDQGKINNRALATVAAGNRRVFREKLVSADKDTAVTFLVDHSGSMEYGPDRQAMKAVIAFLETLEGTKIKTEVLTYTTNWDASEDYHKRIVKAREAAKAAKEGYGRVEGTLHVIVKGFDEPYGLKIKRRISNYQREVSANNCDGDSVKWAYERIKTRPEQRKVLFVLTDGCVCNAGDDRKGMAYLKKVTKVIEADPHVELICLAIEEATAKKYYKNCVDITGAENLPATLMGELRKLLKV
jgi:cobaltochelatase CobT